LNKGVETMKKITLAVIILAFIPIGYVGAKYKKTVDPDSGKTLMTSKGYLPLPAKYKHYFYKDGMTRETKKADLLDCLEGQRRIIGYGRIGAEDVETKPHRRNHGGGWAIIQCMENKGYIVKKLKLIESSDYR
jgi:hypothetical protein